MKNDKTTQEKNVERMERNARMWAAKMARVNAWKNGEGK